jgi:hypothetical protein
VAEHRSGASAWVSAAFMLVVLSGGGLGVARAGLPRGLLGVWLLPLVYFTAVSCVFIGSVRYRVPLMPFVELAAAAGWVRSRNDLLHPTARRAPRIAG